MKSIEIQPFSRWPAKALVQGDEITTFLKRREHSVPWLADIHPVFAGRNLNTLNTAKSVWRLAVARNPLLYTLYANAYIFGLAAISQQPEIQSATEPTAGISIRYYVEAQTSETRHTAVTEQLFRSIGAQTLFANALQEHLLYGDEQNRAFFLSDAVSMCLTSA